MVEMGGNCLLVIDIWSHCRGSRQNLNFESMIARLALVVLLISVIFLRYTVSHELPRPLHHSIVHDLPPAYVTT